MSRQLPVRELYCPSHFGNSYEVALPREMEGILSEARYWGFNRFGDWFDTIDLYDLYHKTHKLWNMPEAMWDRKFSNFSVAQRLGFDLALMITPNHVFYNQVTPKTEATKDNHIFGQLVCPSKPGVREMILDNYRNLFEDFARRGLRLRAIEACPYDYGGCACAKCRPWIVTFGKLYREIALLARKTFGDVEAGLIGWWWSDEDHQVFSAWADRHAPGFFQSLAFHLPYGVTSYKARPIPKGAKERAFVHISYGETSWQDAYGHRGPPIAPLRIEKTVADLISRGAEGYCAYSEGIYDEINKAVLGGLSSGRFGTADAALKAYAGRYLSGSAEGWSEWFELMGDAFAIDVKRARPLFDKLAPKSRPGWRLQQLEERLIMAEADAVVRKRKKWDATRLKAAEAFWASKERLYRDCWRLGLMRHVFRFEDKAPEWQPEYLKALGLKEAQPATKMSSEA